MPFIKKELDFNGYYIYGVILQGLSKFYKANGIFFSSKYDFVLCWDVLKPFSRSPSSRLWRKYGDRRTIFHSRLL